MHADRSSGRRVGGRATRRLGTLAALAAVVAEASAAAPACDPDDGGLRLAEGLCALVVARDVGAVRHLAVAANGDVFAALRPGGAQGGVLALRDTDGDGRADVRRRFGPRRGHGLLLTPSHLWFAPDDAVVRWPWRAGQLEPEGAPERVVDGLPVGRQHAAKALALGPDGALYVNVGAPSNACQEKMRTPRSPGLDPCPQRERHAGIWRFDANAAGQRFAPEARFATGLRHTLALAVHPGTGVLWGAVNGRDQLGQLWGYSDARNAQLPAEELVAIGEGDDFGWPYCYHDGLAGKKVLAPEYGGDGEQVGRCADKAMPAAAFPAHWAPMALVFSRGDALGAAYRDGAFVSFHGSWNRAPLPQEGYRVVFVPFADGRPAGATSGEPWRLVAIGAGSPTAVRFTGLALGPDGSLYAAADANETVWRLLPN